MKVLFIDDDYELLDIYKEASQDTIGADNCVFAGSAEEALALIEKETPRVIVTDHKMKELSGTDFCLKVKSQHPMIHTVLISAFVPTINQTDLSSAFDHCISKPANIESIVDYISYFV